MALRWRREPVATGLAYAFQGERGYQLRENGEIIIHVDPLTGKDRWTVVGWFWYGLDKNTAYSPVQTADEAKAQAMAYIKAYRAKKSADSGDTTP